MKHSLVSVTKERQIFKKLEALSMLYPRIRRGERGRGYLKFKSIP